MRKWLVVIVAFVVLSLAVCTAWADAPKLPGWQSVEWPRVAAKGSSVTISTGTGTGYEGGSVKLVVKDTLDWSVVLTDKKNISSATNGKLSFTFSTSTSGFVSEHIYTTELFVIPEGKDSNPETWKGYWNSVLTVVPANVSGLHLYMNKTRMETGYDGFYVTAYDPDAANVWIVLDGETHQGYSGNSFTWIDGFYEPGSHTVSAVSMNANGNKHTTGPERFTVVSEDSPELYGTNVIPVTYQDGNTTKSLQELPEIITAGKDLVYTIKPVTKNLGQDAQGLDQQVWYDSELEDFTEPGNSLELPCYEKRYEPEVAHGLLLNETTGARTVTIDHSKLLVGHVYQLNVRIRSAGRTPVVISKTFVVQPASMDNQNITFSFEGQNAGQSAIDCQIYDEFNFAVNAPGASILRIWAGDHFEYGPGPEMHMSWMTWYGGTYKYYAQAYYGEINETPWDQVNWDASHISNILTVNSSWNENRTAVYPEYSVLSDTVTQGDYYTVTLTNVDKLNSPDVYVGAQVYNENDVDSHYDRMGDTIMVATADLEPGYYTLAVYTETIGAGYCQNAHCFRVVAPQNAPQNNFMVTTTVPAVNGVRTVDSFEDFSVTFYAPDKDGYSKYYRFYDGQNWWDDRWYERSQTVGVELEPGTWAIRAEVVYEPDAQGLQEIRYESEHIRITAASNGDSAIRPQGSGSYQKGGNGYTVRVVDTAKDQLINPEAYGDEYWEMALMEADGTELFKYSRENGQNPANTFTFPDDCFEAGKAYKVHFHLNVLGYDPVDEEIYFTAVDPAMVSNSLELFVNHSSTGSAGPFVAHTNFNVKVNKAENITAVRVLRGDRWDIWQGDDPFEDEWSFGAGTYGIVAQGTTDTPVWEADNFDWGSFDWDRDVHWTIISNTVTVNINAPNGRLVPPTLSLDKHQYTRGETITATVGKVAGTQWYDLRALPVDEYGNEDWEHCTELSMDLDGSGNGTFDFSVHTIHMEPGQYKVWVDNNGTGYSGNSSATVTFEIVAGSQTPTAVLELPQQIRTNENISFYAYVPEADDIWVEIRKQGEPGWRQDRNEGRAYAEWVFGEAFRGTYAFTLYAHVNGEKLQAVGPVDLEVRADSGDLEDVTFTVNKNTVTIGANGASNGISGTFRKDSRAEWYQVRLLYRGPDGDWGEDEIKSDFRSENSISNAFVYDKTDFNRGTGVYEIRVIGGSTGYNGTDNSCKILAVETQNQSIELDVYGQNGTTGETLNVQANEQLTVRIHAPGATAVRLFDGERWEWWDGRCLDEDGWAEFGRSHDSGEYDFVAQASYDPGYDWNTFNDWDNLELHWTALSNVVHVSAASTGMTDVPVIASIGRVTRGELVSVTVTSAGDANSPMRATSLDAQIQNEDGWNIGDGIGYDDIEQSDYPCTFQFPTGNMEPGLYEVYVYAHAVGYNTACSCATFEVVEPVKDSFILEVQDQLIAERNFCISAYSSGASWIELYLRNLEDEHPFSWGPFWGDYIYYTQGNLDSGEYEIWAVAHYYNEQGQETGTKTSQTVVREVNWKGVLNEPVIHAESAYNVSDGISFTVDGLNQNGWWWVELYDTDTTVQNEEGDEVWARVNSWHSYPMNGQFTYSDGLIAGHAYHIYAGVDDEGYEEKGTGQNVLVYGGQNGNITLSVEENGGYTLNHWPSSRNLHITVSASGSSAIRLWNDDHWQWFDSRAMDAQGNYIIDCNYNDARTYSIVAQASFDKKQDGTAYNWDNVDFSQFDPNNELNWTATSNQVSVTVYANGQLDEPAFTAPSAVKRGNDIVVRITNVIDGQWYGATLRRPEGENVTDFIQMDENNRITIPTEQAESGVYDLCIWTDSEGKLGREVCWEILIDNLAGASVFTLPSGISTVEADAFDGVSMEVVVIQGKHRNLDLSFLNGKNTRYLVAGDGNVTIPDRHSYIVITPDQYNIIK